MNWSKGGGYDALHKSDFWPLLQKAREQTYTPKNISGAWSGAGLIPYNKQKILRCLKGPLSSILQDKPQEQIQTTRKPRQFQSIMAQTDHLMTEDVVGTIV